MSRTVVAIDAVHVMARGLRDLILGQRGIFRVILGNTALLVFDVDVRHNLALFVGGHIVDFVGDIHVPVDALGGSGGGIAAAGLDEHAYLAHGVLLVVRVVGE